jgi:hypothetical protein
MNAHRTGSLLRSALGLLQDVAGSRDSKRVQFIIHTNKYTVFFALDNKLYKMHGTYWTLVV